MRYFKKGKFALTCLVSILSVSMVANLTARAYTEPRWVMSYLTSSKHYTDSSGKTWYQTTAFYLPQFLTGVENTGNKCTYYKTSRNGGDTWFFWKNNNFVNDILTPDNPPQPGNDYYYQFGAYVTNSDAQYNEVPYYSDKFYIDAKAPTATFSPICCTGSSKPINITISAYDSGGGGNFSGDSGSGLNHYIYRISADNGGTWGSWSGNKTIDTTATFSKPGTYQIEVEAFDNVGNQSDWVSGSYVYEMMDAGGTVSNTAGQYRTNTDVITSVSVSNSGGDITPETGATVTFSIPGITTQSKSFVLPAGGSEPVWFKWHTPSSPADEKATITISAGSSIQTITPTFNIYTLTEKTPPNTDGHDRADPYFQYTSPPNLGTTSSATWSTYSAHQEQRIGQIWNDSKKALAPYTYTVWVYTTNSYYASLTATLKATPSASDPTAAESYGVWKMKSGYGLNENVTASVSTNDSSAVTGAQNVIGYYPEFMYNDTGYLFGGYDRIFETLTSGLNSTFNLKSNPYSEPFPTPQSPLEHVHFVPIWYADNVAYQPTTLIFDAFSPGGMLSAQSSDSLNIQGNCFGDWSVLPTY